MTKQRHSYYSSPKRKVQRARWRAAHVEREMWHRARARARKSGLAFTIKQVDIVIPVRCPVFGFKLIRRANDVRGGAPNSPSLDRINNRRGYTPGNIRVISRRANTLKRDASLRELQLLVKFLGRCV